MCLLKVNTPRTLTKSKLHCSGIESIVLPVKSQGLYEFIKLYSQFDDGGSILLGMNKTDGVIEFTDHTELDVSKLDNDFFIFDVEDEECVILDNNNGYNLKGVQCNETHEYYCLWQSKF